MDIYEAVIVTAVGIAIALAAFFWQRHNRKSGTCRICFMRRPPDSSVECWRPNCPAKANYEP